jgi:hypothetical protein
MYWVKHLEIEGDEIGVIPGERSGSAGDDSRR